MKTKLIKIAEGEVGYKQSSNGSNKYGQWYGMDKQAWCAMFISWCAAQAGIGTSIIPKFAYVPSGVDYYKRQGRFKAKGYTPQPGDIVFYDFNSNGTADHVGLVVGYSNSRITAIEGNTSSVSQANGGNVEKKNRNTSLVLGYGLPDYEEEEVEIKTVKVKSLDTGDYIDVEAVNVNGSNYIKLRDVEKLAPIKIDWDGKTPTMNLAYK